MALNIVDLPAPPQASAEDDVPRYKNGRPKIFDPEKGKIVGYTRTTTFIDCIEDKTNLAKWGKRSVLVGVSLQPSILDVVRELDQTNPDDKRKLDALTERAVDLAGSNDKRDKGSHLHALSELVDDGEQLPESISEADLMDMAAYKLATIDFDVVEKERYSVCDEIRTAGTPDRVVRYTGPGPDDKPISGLFIGDLKTGSVEYGALKMAMQLSIYSRSSWYDWRTETRSPMQPEISKDWGFIVHLPAGQAQCTVYWIDLQLGWEAVQVARQVRALRSKKNVLRPFCASVTEDTLAPSPEGV